MSYRSRYGRPTRGSGDRLPTWLVFLLGAALIFGAFYVWQGVQTYVRTGGLGVVESTQRAGLLNTATAVRVTAFFAFSDDSTPLPTLTPVATCTAFIVSVPNAIVREGPASAAGIITSLKAGQDVCVVGIDPNSDWYAIDLTPETRHLDLAYMNDSVIRAVNPTLRPTKTVTALPTVTPLPPTITLTPTPTPTPNPHATSTPTPTPPPTGTDIRQSA